MNRRPLRGPCTISRRCPAGYTLLLVDQHDDLAADDRAAVVQLQIFAEVLIAGGRAVAGGEGEAVHANKIWRFVAALVACRAASRSTQQGKRKQLAHD